MHSFSIYDFFLLLKQAFQINLINNTKMYFTAYKKNSNFQTKTGTLDRNTGIYS